MFKAAPWLSKAVLNFVLKPPQTRFREVRAFFGLAATRIREVRGEKPLRTTIIGPKIFIIRVPRALLVTPEYRVTSL